MFKELPLRPLDWTAVLEEELLLLFPLKLPGLGRHGLLFLSNLQGLLSIEQYTLSPRLPVEHVVGVGPVQLAAGGQRLVQLDQGSRPVTGANTQQPPSLVDLEINTS